MPRSRRPGAARDRGRRGQARSAPCSASLGPRSEGAEYGIRGVFEHGVILPNYGAGDLGDRVLRVAEAAEELGFDSVWSTEHFLVGQEAAGMFDRILDSLTTLAWLAGRTDRIGRSEEHTSELQSLRHLVCRLLLEKKKHAN